MSWNRIFTRSHSGFTLIEIMIVVVLMSIAAAVVVPQFMDSTDEAAEAGALRNLQQLRRISRAVQLQNASGLNVVQVPSILPVNPLTGKDTVKGIATAEPRDPQDLTPGGGGWIYSYTSNEYWIDTAGYLHY